MSDYQRMIDNLQSEVSQLKTQLAEKESQLSIKPFERGVERELSWLDGLSHQISENVQDRINLQKALFELEETNLRNRTELQHLDDAIAKQATEKDVVEALSSRRQVILDNIRDNDEAGVNYQRDIEENEKHRCELQDMLNEAINNNGNKTYLHILNQYKLLVSRINRTVPYFLDHEVLTLRFTFIVVFNKSRGWVIRNYSLKWQ
jgi:kinesin family protein 18/19